ncbi:MAG: hypothetical protein LBB20_00310 [Puniceicoccales bacterium]|jgi:hypothetical protein|nr:hypothetical protein [Puniceicoccales bacterium]
MKAQGINIKSKLVAFILITIFLINSRIEAVDKPVNVEDRVHSAEDKVHSVEDKVHSAEDRVHLEKIKFAKNRLLVAMKRWGEIKINIRAVAANPKAEWVDDCRIKLYIGYNGLGKNGKMLAFKSSCKIFTLPNNSTQSIYFYLPGDLRKRYKLTQDPDFYTVRITVDGVKMPLGELECSQSLKTPKQREDFYKKIKKEASLLESALCNANQLPPYADLKVDSQPTLRRN